MKEIRLLTWIAVGFLHGTGAGSFSAEGKPYVDGRFQGRIAYSCDGNHNDPDDWAASPVTLAILSEMGLKDRLVHFDYNCILPLTDPEWETTHAESVLGTAKRYGFDKGLFFDCQKDRDGAVTSIAKAINDSTAEDPLYFIIAGPMEVPYLGIQKSDPAKRQFVYCISHSRWNDGFASKYKFTFNKRSVIEQEVHWVQIRDQNRLLSFGRYGRPSTPEEFAPYFWMRYSNDAHVRWLWERMTVSTRPDPSDAGMTWFLATGDEECNPVKLKRLIEEHHAPAPLAARKQVRMEAENFRNLEGCVLEDRNDKQASHALNTRLAGETTGRIRTRFDEPFTCDSARYDVEIRYFDAKGPRCRFALFVNGVAQGAAWESPGEGRGWLCQTIRDVPVGRGCELMLEVRGGGGDAGKLDYVQLNYRSDDSAVVPSANRRTTASGPLDDPDALSGQVIVAGGRPGYLKYNGGGPAFLCGPLRVHPDNPRYFTDGTGKAIYLTGSHMGWELQDHSWGREHVFDFPGFVEALAARHHNFMRLWIVEHTRWDQSNPRAVATPMPYRRTGPGTALDGQPKFDLEQLNPAHFERLRARVQAAGKRGIYVAIMLFQGFSLHQTRQRNPWFGHPFNPTNNINGIDGDTNRDGDGREVHTLTDARVTALQERYVRKVVDTVNDLDNVLYEIGNECGAYSTEWQYHMIRFIRRYETDKPKQHPVGMTVQIPGGHRNNQVLFDSPADWISPNNEGGYGQDPPAAGGRKVILSDTDHHGHKPHPGRREWVWKSFLRGHNPIFLDLYPDQETNQLDRITQSELDPQWEPIRQAMGRTRLLAERINLAAMLPRNELASTGYCLANVGAEYLVYLPDSKEATVDLGDMPRSFAVEWFNPETGEIRQVKSALCGGTVSFVSPFQSKHAVLHLKRMEE